MVTSGSRVEALDREGSDRLEHEESWIAVRVVLRADQALLRQRCQDVEDVHGLALLAGDADGLGRVEGPAAHEHAESLEELALRLVEQVVAPGDGRPERLLARRQVARSTREERQTIAESRQDGLRAQEAKAGRRELDRQRQAVEPCRDLGDGRGVLVGDLEVRAGRDGSLDEQADRGVLRQRGNPQPLVNAGQLEGWHRKLLLATDPQDGPGGDDDLERLGPAEQLGNRGRGRQQLLEVVEHEQRPAGAQRLDEALERRPSAGKRHPDRLRDGRRQQHRLRYRRERHEVHPVGKSVRDVGRELQGHPGLAGSARAGQRQQPRPIQQADRLRDDRLAPDEARDLHGQVVRRRVERPRRREVVAEALDDELRETALAATGP